MGDGVVSDTSTTWPEASVIVNPVGIAEMTAHPSWTTNGGAPAWIALIEPALASVLE